MNKELVKKISGIFMDILISAIIIFALIISVISITTTKDGIPNLFGYSPFTIQSNSMYPFLKKGDLIIVRKYNGEEIKKNDVISFFASEQGVKIIKTHRVVDISDEMGVYLYTTKGDNNEVEDDIKITDASIVGVYNNKKVSKLGYVIDFFKSKYGFLFFIIIPLAIIFIKQVIDLFKMLLSYKLEEN